MGLFLSNLRLATEITGAVHEELGHLLQNDNADVDDTDAVVITCLRKEARKWSEDKLNAPQIVLRKEKIDFYGIDRHGSIKHVNTDQNLRDYDNEEEDESKVFLDVDNRKKSLFSSLSTQPVLQLRIGAKFVCLQTIGQDINVGTRGEVGEVISFRPASEASHDVLLDERALPIDVTQAQVRDDWNLVQAERRWPLVRFSVLGGPVFKTVYPALDIVNDVLGTVLYSRMQVPLVLCYAMTVHRSQGQTLDKVGFLVNGLFSHGQMYSAMSRVRKCDDLKLIRSAKRKMRLASPVVVEFEKSTARGPYLHSKKASQGCWLPQQSNLHR